MSRSRRHTPITGITTAQSEKHDKQLSARRLRVTQAAILRTADPDSMALPMRGRDVTSQWMSKDGKHYWRASVIADKPHLMRK
jgi:hypothetical protein